MTRSLRPSLVLVLTVVFAGAAALASAPARAQAAAGTAAEQAMQAAMTKADAGDYKGALAILEPLKKDPALPTGGKALLATLYLETGRPGDALALLEPLTTGKPDPALLYNAARAAARVGQGEKGRRWLEQAAAMQPASPAGRDLGMALAREGRVVEAYVLLRPWAAVHPNDSDARVAAAALAIELERPAEAAVFLQGLDAKNPAIQLLQAKTLVLAGDPKRAIELVKPLMAKHPEGMDTEVRRTLAEAYVLADQPKEAQALLEGKTRGIPELVLVLGRAQRRAGNPKAALATLEPLGKHLPQPGAVGDPRPAVRIAVEYGSLLVQMGRAAEAVSVLQQATKLNPQSPPAWEQLAEALVAAGRKGEAEPARAKAAELTQQVTTKLAVSRAAAPPTAAAGGARPSAPVPSADVQAKVARFRAQLSLGRYVEARKLAEEMLASSPKNADYLYQVAVVDMAQKQTTAAETHFKAALASAPNHVAALNDYAVLLMQQNRRDEARRMLQKVL
ncbi:MAG TPA: tetratricopeptide repeat protein, partial [Thermoanaerobaculia bacterium]|nr:tetratricopeptide repeat protein [Thermoanaerobaculia bacterium]